MKVSKNWLQEYLGFDLPAITELVERIGSQLGAVEATEDIGAKYAGVVVAKVVECSKLENTDRLNLCYVDDGGVVADVARRDDGLVQVVCGAPNVRAGVTVAWLPPGATVPSTFGAEPFVMEARELRGAISNGMLVSPKEAAIGDGHDGILLLDDNLAAGANFAQAYKLNDEIIDIENKMFTHRPDCFGQLGVAREVAGIFGQQFASPDWYLQPTNVAAGSGLALSVTNDVPQVVPRFMALALKNITIIDSPLWLQTQLSRVGMRPINNVVDISNYLMLLTGQPTHAYDYDKVAALSDSDGASLVVRYAQADEQLELLSGKTITPRAEAIMIATNQQAIGLGGVMGGGNTEVDPTTKNIIFECATFDMYSIRRTSMAHGLFTDAVTRFNKGQSPLQNSAVLAKAVELLQQLAGAEVASEIIDISNAPAKQPSISVDAGFINSRLGFDLSAEAMATLLQNVEFEVELDNQTLTIQSPFWRTDIEQPEDIVEEVGRLYGFDKLPLQLPQRGIAPTAQDPLLLLNDRIRGSLVRAGANELLTYSFVHGNLLDKAGQDKTQAFKLSNALSPDLQYYRFNALPSLLDKVHLNIKAGYDRFALFEISKGHSTALIEDAGLPQEAEMLDLVFVSNQNFSGAAFYHARRYLDALAHEFNLTLEYEPLTEVPTAPAAASYNTARTAQVSIAGIQLGFVGELNSSVRKQLKLPDYCAGFSIDRTQLLLASQSAAAVYAPLPRFPKIEQDLCLRVPLSVTFAALHSELLEVINDHKPANSRIVVTTLDIYQPAGVDYKQITFRIGLASYVKTMTDQEMTGLFDKISALAAEALGAERV